MTEDERIEAAANAMGFRTIDGQARVMAALAAAYPELHGKPTHWLAPMEANEDQSVAGGHAIMDERRRNPQLMSVRDAAEHAYVAMRDAYLGSMSRKPT